MKTKIIINLHRGLVSSVESDIPLEIAIIDGDTEGVDDKELCTINDEKVYASIDEAIIKDKKAINEVFEQIK